MRIHGIILSLRLSDGVVRVEIRYWVEPGIQAEGEFTIPQNHESESLHLGQEIFMELNFVEEPKP